MADDAEKVELAVLGINDGVKELFSRCDDQSVIAVQDIRLNKPLWKELVADNRVTISFDLYYCGILMFDHNRVKQHYKINF
jgi:hypothetical protein